MPHAVLIGDSYKATPWWDVPGIAGDVLYQTPTGEFMTAFREDAVEGDECRAASASLAIVRSLPEDTYVPVDHVLALLTAASHWSKAFDISWMEMVELGGCSQPVQSRMDGVVLAYTEDDVAAFVVIAPGGMETVRILTDCVTHIRLCNVVPYPENTLEKARRVLQEQALVGLQTDG